MATKPCEDRLDAFFATLSSELSTHHGSSESQFAVERQLARMKKRARYVRPELEQSAIDGFLAVNDAVSKFECHLSPIEIANSALFIRKALERVTSFFDPDDIQGVLCHDALHDLWRFGPGASFEVKGTHCAEKIYEPMTCTVRAVPRVIRLRMRHPYLSLYDKTKGGGVRVVRGSKMTTVPKNQDTMRTIAVEPSGNMALQLAAGRYLEDALRYVGVDITTQQPKNKALARQGSLGGLATIDLKSASDMFHPELVRLLLPDEWYVLLMALRSHETRLPSGEWVKLQMISTMGNGFTFPLMTLIILSLIYASRCNKPGAPTLYVDMSRTAVFGDDIIIPSDEYVDVTSILERSGLVVNHDKSYRDGPFRESCGGDYYQGYDVTPFYCKSLSKTSDIYVVANQLLSWSARHEVCVVRTLKLLFSFLPSKPFLVPEWHQPDSGVRCSSGPRFFKHLARVPLKVKLNDEFFLASLAAGGYLESRGGAHAFFSPRTDHPKMKVRTCRIPSGYDDGWDPLLRSQKETSWVSLMVKLGM